MKVDLLGQDASTGSPQALYSPAQFEADVQNFKPRVFDTYILPGFMMYYAWKSKGMRKVARRILFTSGIYMMYRNYAEYKKAIAQLQATLQPTSTEGGTPV